MLHLSSTPTRITQLTVAGCQWRSIVSKAVSEVRFPEGALCESMSPPMGLPKNLEIKPPQAKDFLGIELPKEVRIVEVGPRDGLQNEKDTVRDGPCRLLKCRLLNKCPILGIY